MKPDRSTIIEEIRKFIENPTGTLQLDVAWVAQARVDFPKHLSDEHNVFLCGTRYLHDENTDGSLMEIALEGKNKSNIPTHSVNFIFSDHAEFILCKKCLKWLRKQLKPLVDSNRSFQERTRLWLLACFGATVAADKAERNHRFLEEALELVQACGGTRDEAHQLVEYVYNRPVGEKSQEVGGVMVTLAALCFAQEIELDEAAETELARVWTKIKEIRAKQAAKPLNSPLPQKTF